MKRSAKVEMPFSIERNDSEVDYVAVYTVTPFRPAKTSGPPEKCSPEEGGDVEDVEVFVETVKRCKAHRFMSSRVVVCRECKVVRESRPELVDLVSEEELLEHAGETADADEPPERDPDEDRDAAADRDREARDEP